MLLCQMGYARAVIVEVERIHENWKKVSFSHQEPRPEQKHQEPRQRTPWPQRSFHEQVEVRPIINLDQVEQLSAQCILNTGFGISEVKDFFTSATDILCRNFDIEGLPEFIQKAIRPAPEGNIDLSIYDRLLIYTDGSSKPEGKRFPPQRADELGMADTWAFLVLGEKFQIESGAHEVHALGWTAHPVRYDVDGHAFTGATRIGSDQAEKAALTFPGLWRLAQNINTTTVICTDAATAGGQAFGHIGAADPDDAFCLLRSTYQALQCALPPDRLLLHHTRSHAGDPYNEFVDIAAKAEAASSFNHPRQKIDLSSWRSHMLHFWMIFATDYGVPQWKDRGFEVPAPALPQQECQLHTEEHTGANFHRTIDIECGLCLATANVQSLARGPEGHGGKLHYLQMQMKAFHINCMGIQEARTERGLRTANNILAFASGSKGGNLGMELWINLEQPIGWQRKRGHTQQHFLHRSDFCVVHGDERRLLVRCDHTSCSFWLFTTHAPHSGRPLRERQEWWEATTELLQRHCDQDPIFWLMDANAPPGKADGAVVFEPGFSSTASTALLRAALEAQELCLPATSKCHAGSHSTWTAIDGQSEHCIDHIAIPQAWRHTATWSQVLHEFDLAQEHDDHQVVALQLQWNTQVPVPIKRDMNTKHQMNGGLGNFTNDAFKQQLSTYRPPTWHTDVEAHADGLIQHLHTAMKEESPEAHHPGQEGVRDGRSVATTPSETAAAPEMQAFEEADWQRKSSTMFSSLAWRS